MDINSRTVILPLEEYDIKFVKISFIHSNFLI